MIFLLLFVLFLFLIPWRTQGGEQPAKYLSRNHTNLVNGFFIFVVFVRHFCCRNPQMNAVDSLYILKEGCTIGQLLVSTFFFFSGYGIQLSLSCKGMMYARNLIQKRFAGLILRFGILVLVYLLIQYLLGVRYSIGHIAMSMLAWKAVGNPSWFIFMTLAEYLIIAVCYVLFCRWGRHAVVLGVMLATSVWMFFIGTCKPDWYVNTILCVPFGMLFSLYLERFHSFQQKAGKYVLLLVPLLIFAAQYLHVNGYYLTKLPILNFWAGSLVANTGAGLFALGMALFAGWLSLVSPKLSRAAGFLSYCGGPALFYIYMLHMIPLMLGQQFGLSAYGEWYLVVSLLITAILTYVALQVDKLICRK